MDEQQEPKWVVPSEIEYWINHLLQPLVTKITDLEVQVTTLNGQVEKFQTLVDGFKGNGIAKRLLGVA